MSKTEEETKHKTALRRIEELEWELEWNNKMLIRKTLEAHKYMWKLNQALALIPGRRL